MSRKPESCPFCGAAEVLRIVYGLPTKEVLEQAEEGKIALGGCCVDPDYPDWRCASCERSWVVREGKVIEAARDGEED